VIDKPGVGVLKTLWAKRPDGAWTISDIKGLDLEPKPGSDPDFYEVESDLALMTNSPRGSIHEVFASFGPTDFLLKQSILPVLALVHGESAIRCIGTAFVIGCTGFLITAGHVLLDPQESGYGEVTRDGNTLKYSEKLWMGVLVPLNSAYGGRTAVALPFESCWYWGDWHDSPLLHRQPEFKLLTDVAICKVPMLPNGVPHQPLNLSVWPFKMGERAFAVGYAEMADIPLITKDGQQQIADFDRTLYVSIGEVTDVFPDNHLSKAVPTPGPCAEFRARIPGKMSGSPIFGAQGALVRGVVSRSFSGEKHAYGSMLAPVLHLPMREGQTLKTIMETGNEGIPVLQGPQM